ncbi:MAG: toxin ParE1/3/4 [Enterobacterales bacterium]|jgi:toxin ParE1/3/4
MNLKFTAQALKDLHRLKLFIEDKNPVAANKYIERLLKTIKQLKVQPKIGKVLTEESLARQLVAADYIVRYSIRGNTVYILKIWHGKEER